MSKSLVEITGFDELQKQLKRLSDKVKRKELLKILRQVAEPARKAAENLAPVSDKDHYRYVGVTKGKRRKNVSGSNKILVKKGTLKRSIKKITAKRAKVNAVLHIGAKASRKKGDSKSGYYAHMVVDKGFKGESRKKAGGEFMQRAYSQTKGKVTADAEKKVAKYIQKQIDRLSK